ncbi:MAG TPA: trehalose-phosphatase [Actinomycetota bacterium]|jgi:trehalose 6-phosphate phosphatase
MAEEAGILLDFDGSLSAIVARPDDARPVEGAREVLAALAVRYRVVAVISGRRSEEVAALLDVPKVRYFGLYGLEEAAPELVAVVAPRVQAAAAAVPEAWVEDKGASIAVHYRQAPDPAMARAQLIAALGEVASSAGLELVEGKMVVELVPAGRPRKGGAVERIVGENELSAALFAGDDVADVEAFHVLDSLAEQGLLAVKVAVRGEDTPRELLDGAAVVVDGPTGLVELLRQLT